MAQITSWVKSKALTTQFNLWKFSSDFWSFNTPYQVCCQHKNPIGASTHAYLCLESQDREHFFASQCSSRLTLFAPTRIKTGIRNQKANVWRGIFAQLCFSTWRSRQVLLWGEASSLGSGFLAKRKMHFTRQDDLSRIPWGTSVDMIGRALWGESILYASLSKVCRENHFLEIACLEICILFHSSRYWWAGLKPRIWGCHYGVAVSVRYAEGAIFLRFSLASAPHEKASSF